MKKGLFIALMSISLAIAASCATTKDPLIELAGDLKAQYETALAAIKGSGALSDSDIDFILSKQDKIASYIADARKEWEDYTPGQKQLYHDKYYSYTDGTSETRSGISGYWGYHISTGSAGVNKWTGRAFYLLGDSLDNNYYTQYMQVFGGSNKPFHCCPVNGAG